MFKGFIPTDGKKPTEKVRGRTEFYDIKDVENLTSYGGVLADDIILIDLDEKEESELLYKIVQDLNLKCNVIQTTRGKHFYFKNTDVKKNSIHKLNSLGLTIDVKIGSKNAVIPIKIDGALRPWLMEYDKLDYLPSWLKVIDGAIDFKKMQEGDGRNQSLFNYILCLQRNGIRKAEIIETIQIINTYILDEPLSDGELNTILRDESFDKECFYSEKGALLHDVFASFIKENHHIINLNNQLHIYDSGIYVDNVALIERAMIEHIPILTKSKRTEVLEYLKLIAPNKELSESNLIALNNGLFNVNDNSLQDFNPNYISKNKIPISYNPDAFNKDVEKTLNKITCNDSRLKRLVNEMVGYCLYRRNELGKSFILTGDGSNGKSTLLDMIKALLGSTNVASLSLDELNQRFKTAELYGKLANIGDDISNKYLDDNSIFKKLVTGETVNVEKKGGNPFDFDNYSKLIFASNDLPRINDTTNGLMRRLVIIPFNARFSNKDADFDPYIKDKLIKNDALEYLLKLGLEGLQRILKNRRLTEVKEVTQELKEYERRNNPILDFIEEFKIENEDRKTVYLKYNTWCNEFGLRALSNIQFGRELSKYGFTPKQIRLNDSRIYIYVKKGDV